MIAAGNMQPPTLRKARSQEHETPEKPQYSCGSRPSSNGVCGLTIASGFHVNGRDVLLPLVTDDPLDFACTNRIARLARSNGGFTTTCSGPLTRVQIMVTALLDPLMASKALLRAREQLMRIADAAPSTEAVHCRNIETYVSDLTRDTPLLAVHLLFDGSEADVAHAVNTNSPALLAAMEKIIGGNAQLKLPTQRNARRLVQAVVRLPAAALSCGRYSGRCIGERIVQLHQSTDAVPSLARNHNIGILRGVASVMIAIGNDCRELDMGAHAWAARSGASASLAHWEMDAQGFLRGSLSLPVPTHLGCGICSNQHCTDVRQFGSTAADEESAQVSTDVLPAVALAQSLATLRTQAIEQLQRHSTSPATNAIGIADSGNAAANFSDNDTQG